MFRNPVVVRTIAMSSLGWAGASLVACLLSWLIVGPQGLGCAAVAAAVGLIFPLLTVLAIAAPDRSYGSAPYAARVFFGFLVGFVLKVVLFIVALLVLLEVAGIAPGPAYGTLLATALVSLGIDVFIAN